MAMNKQSRKKCIFPVNLNKKFPVKIGIGLKKKSFFFRRENPRVRPTKLL